MQTIKLNSQKGFTLVELVFVIVIIGALALVVVPNYASRVAQSKIASTKANVDSLRTAIDLYRADNNALPNATLTDLTSGGYIRKIPTEAISNSAAVANSVTNAGGWTYNTTSGAVQPNLSGNDANGLAYSAY